MALIPYYLYTYNDDNISGTIASALSIFLLGIAWLPCLHAKMVEPELVSPHSARNRAYPYKSFEPVSPHSARNSAYLYNSIWKILFVVIFLAIYVSVKGLTVDFNSGTLTTISYSCFLSNMNKTSPEVT